MHLIDYFINICPKIFHFLEENFDFIIAEIKRDRFGAEIIYKNLTTGIKIRFEPREFYVFITLYRLINGNLPVYKDLKEYDSDLTNRFDFDDLIDFRMPFLLSIEQKSSNSFTQADLEKILSRNSYNLQLYCKDILKGDFQVFTELARIRIKRKEEYKTKR